MEGLLSTGPTRSNLWTENYSLNTVMETSSQRGSYLNSRIRTEQEKKTMRHYFFLNSNKYLTSCSYITKLPWTLTSSLHRVRNDTWHVTHHYLVSFFFLSDFWHQCYYPHTSRDSVSPVCGVVPFVKCEGDEVVNYSFSIKRGAAKRVMLHDKRGQDLPKKQIY